MTTKILVKSKNAKLDELSPSVKEKVQKAVWDLSPEQYDRYVRAVNVWFDTKTNTLSIKDREV